MGLGTQVLATCAFGAGFAVAKLLPKLLAAKKRTAAGRSDTLPHFVPMPHPGWKPGVKQPPPFGAHLRI